MKRSTLASLAFLSFLFITLASPVSAKDNWTRVRTKNFELVGNASDKEIRKVATRLEQFRDVFARLLEKSNFSSSTPTTVVVFKDFSSYKKFAPPNTAGYFQPGEDRNYITLSAVIDEANDPFKVIFHEFVHLLVKNNVQNMPLWFNEGLAEYYSTFQIKEGDRKVWLGKVISTHVFTLRERKLVPFQTLFEVDHRSPLYNESDKSSLFYAESWALVHYLLLNPQRQPQLNRFLNLLLTGQSPDKAFPVAFGADYSVIEKELKEYVKHDTYPSQIATFEQKLEFDLEMQSTPLSEAEGEFYLGDLLNHTSQLDQAEKHLQKAIALDPSLAIAYASLGMLEMHRGKFEEAKRYLERAAAANTGNYVVHYYYAYVLSREAMGADGMIFNFPPALALKLRAELKKAIELAPNFADSYRLLSLVNIVTNEQLDESIVLLNRAIELVPGDQEFKFMLAQIYMRKKEYKPVRELLAPIAESSSSPPQLRQQSKSMLDMIILMEKTNAQYETSPEGDSSSRDMIVIGSDDTGVSRTPEDAMAEAMEEALRKPRDGEVRIRGQLLRIDCGSKGVVFAVQADGRSFKLLAPDFQGVDFTTYTGRDFRLTCEPRNPVDEVVVIYKPSKDVKSKFNGEIISVEFVPGNFKLKSNVP